MRSELLAGCGYLRDKRLFVDDHTDWSGLVTLDYNPRCKPDVIHDLNDPDFPFKDETFDEIHMYEVLEHCGKQGDFRFFFRQFKEFDRILKVGGHIFITCPKWEEKWAWGDPGHTRIVGFEQLVYLDKSVYTNGPKVSSMTDYGSYWDKDLKLVHIVETPYAMGWILRKY